MDDNEHYSPALLLSDKWQWAKINHSVIQQWVLWHVKRPSVIYASVVKSLIRLSPEEYRVAVRDRSGLTVTDETAPDLVTAMTAAETHVLFNLRELMQENKA